MSLEILMIYDIDKMNSVCAVAICVGFSDESEENAFYQGVDLFWFWGMCKVLNCHFAERPCTKLLIHCQQFQSSPHGLESILITQNRYLRHRFALSVQAAALGGWIQPQLLAWATVSWRCSRIKGLTMVVRNLVRPDGWGSETNASSPWRPRRKFGPSHLSNLGRYIRTGELIVVFSISETSGPFLVSIISRFYLLPKWRNTTLAALQSAIARW